MSWAGIHQPFLSLYQTGAHFNWSKLQAFAEDKIDVTEKLKLVFGREENFVGKRENAGYQHFLLFPQCFSKGFFLWVVKSRDCVVKD